MKFTCDPVKNQKNIEDRGLPLLAAETMFNEAMLVIEDSRLMVVVFCLAADDAIRIISLRKANAREQKKFKPSQDSD